MNIERVNELKQAFDDENISYGEIAEIESAATELGIKNTEEMQVIDVLLEIEDKLTSN